MSSVKTIKRLLASTAILVAIAATFGAQGASASFSCFEDALSASPPGSQAGSGVAPGCFDVKIDRDSADLEAATRGYSSAGGHPDSITTTVDFNARTTHAIIFGSSFTQPWPAEQAKDAVVDVPPGLLGNPNAAELCSGDEIANFPPSANVAPLCPAESQIGLITIRTPGIPGVGSVLSVSRPLYRVVAPPGASARFAFNILGVIVPFDFTLRNGSDYGVTFNSRNIPEGIALMGSDITLWGIPASPAHEAERYCAGAGEPGCESTAPIKPFLRLPTSCTPAGTGLDFTLNTDSWVNPGAHDAEGNPILSDPNWKSASFTTHDPPGLISGGIYPPTQTPDLWGPERGIEGCENVPFEPSIAVKPTSNQADSPTGLEFDLTMPQHGLEEEGAISESDLKGTSVTLPEGMKVNASSVDGLGSCSPEQIGLRSPRGATPIHFSAASPNCPDNSKIGAVQIETPLLEGPLKGSVYLAAQGDNPFNSLLALYITAEGSGVVIKLPAHVKVGPGGQLTTVVDEAPQTPFSHLRLELKSGPRATLINPPSCGTHTTTATMTPWSGNAAVNLSSSFAITSGPGGQPCPNGEFSPKLSAGTQNPLAGAFTPFLLRLTREDGTRELTGLTATLPPGLAAKLAGVPYCPESALASVSEAEGTAATQLASPSCPSQSQVGTLTVGAGAGPNPFYLATGRAYLAGPYKGAPLSLAFITPAVAGPFDLGSVLLRSALHVDPTTAQGKAVSDPLPTSLHGIPLNLRDVRVNLDRPGFTLNPTSCDPMAIQAQVTGAAGASASLSERFQAATAPISASSRGCGSSSRAPPNAPASRPSKRP